MSNCLDNRKPVTQAQVQSVVLRSLSLSRQISITINDIGSDIVERQTIMMIRELKAGKYLLYETFNLFFYCMQLYNHFLLF